MTWRVAVVVFDGVDILDFCGPTEVLTSFYHDDDRERRDSIFKPSVIGANPTIRSGKALTVSTDLTIDDATESIQDFDILIVPGGQPSIITGMIEQKHPILRVIEAFTRQGSKPGSGQRIVLSVCTGALFLAAAGAFKGMKVTTHHLALEILRQIEPSAEVVSHTVGAGDGRYIDGGVNANGVRVISAGGVTCGLDASLFIGELKAGREAADYTARMLEHEWKRA
ncbi:uncharacterized protein KY384_006579 [Bacidia gigantensis]|uniref:uncharacterized protein n=1 Tax=Bacidia gigantensis TaxID=2732470 RepID=UPI001D038600|nr:uncharacterized protein KY384_006579 [Bacidia gigantensis]KAG8528890.1 hypothetical protein KY384_006579 [Bacidia gigantensis]